MTAYGRFFDRVLSRMDPETAHRLAMRAMRVAARIPAVRRAAWRQLAPVHPGLAVNALGLRFPGPLGLAAGFDKNAVGVDALGALGFGYVEVGTVTARPQPGNPRPRLFRLVPDRAIVNRMGFNNEGAAVVAGRLARRGRRRSALPVVVGVNIGKSKATPESEAVADYEASTRLLAPHADYLVVNVSSPNTPGLRDLQSVERLRPLLAAVRTQADVVTTRRVPLLVKIAPDLSDDDVVAVADLAVELGLDGVIAVNTTVRRDGLSSSPTEVDAAGAGGLSGPPLAKRSLEVLRLLDTRLGERCGERAEGAGDVADIVGERPEPGRAVDEPELSGSRTPRPGRPAVISAGGVESAMDVDERLRAGATLVQAYTGFVYGGPLWPARVQRELRGLLARTP